MSKIADLTEQLASRVMSADPQDPPAMVEILGQLQDLLSSVESLSAAEAATLGPISSLLSGATAAVERIILREVKDAAAALRGVAQDIAELQHLVSGTSGATPPRAGEDRTRAQTSHGDDAAHDTLPPEPTLSADDLPLAFEFVAEAKGHLEAAETALLQVEENPRTSRPLTRSSAASTRSRALPVSSISSRSARWPTRPRTCSTSPAMAS